MTKIKKPFNLQKWIDDNRHLLKPPVGNKNLYVESEDYIVMIVAGPNARKDYHYNETEELFYQIEGSIVVKTQQNGELVESLLMKVKCSSYLRKYLILRLDQKVQLVW